MKTHSVKCCGALALGWGLAAWAFDVEAGLIFQASLRNGDYGPGQRIDTMDPIQGASPHVLGIVDSPDGVTYTSTELDGRSNGLINYQTGIARANFQTHGTIVMSIRASRAAEVDGELFGDNFGYDQWNNGQSGFAANVRRITNSAGIADDQFQVTWKAWHNNVWYFFGGPTLEYDRTYHLGFAWGGPIHDYELWVDGVLLNTYNLPSGVTMPWGQSWGSGANWGLGSNHQRGMGTYGSNVGVTYSDLYGWDEYRPDTSLQAPKLTIVKSGTNIFMTWPQTNADGFGVEAATTLNLPNWAASNQIVEKDGDNYTIIIPIGNTNLFLRLRK